MSKCCITGGALDFFSGSVVCVLYFFLLRERIECGRSSWTATIYPFFVDEHYCMLGMLR